MDIQVTNEDIQSVMQANPLVALQVEVRRRQTAPEGPQVVPQSTKMQPPCFQNLDCRCGIC